MREAIAHICLATWCVLIVRCYVVDRAKQQQKQQHKQQQQRDQEGQKKHDASCHENRQPRREKMDASYGPFSNTGGRGAGERVNDTQKYCAGSSARRKAEPSRQGEWAPKATTMGGGEKSFAEFRSQRKAGREAGKGNEGKEDSNWWSGQEGGGGTGAGLNHGRDWTWGQGGVLSGGRFADDRMLEALRRFKEEMQAEQQARRDLALMGELHRFLSSTAFLSSIAHYRFLSSIAHSSRLCLPLRHCFPLVTSALARDKSLLWHVLQEGREGSGHRSCSH